MRTATESFTLDHVFAVKPEHLYELWLDPEGHAAFTGGAEAQIDRSVGGRFSAWDGYIEGTTLELEPGTRIVQAWRTTEFSSADPDSRLELRFAAEGAGTRLTIVHSGLPAGSSEAYRTGWEAHYFVHMRGVLA